MKLRNIFSILALVAAFTFTAFAQTNTIYLDGSGSSVAAVAGGRAVITIDGDRRTTPDFQYDYVIDNDFGGTYSADFEVWFRNASPATGSGGIKAKIFAVTYFSSQTKLYVQVPTGIGTSNPYIGVNNVFTSFYREFQPGSPSSNGGVFTSNRPHLLSYGGGQPAGYTVFGPIFDRIPDPTLGERVSNPSAPLVQKQEFCVFVTGYDSGSNAPVINFQNTAGTVTQDVSVLSANQLAMDGQLLGYKKYCVIPPNSIRGEDAKIRVKGSTAGSWSSFLYVNF